MNLNESKAKELLEKETGWRIFKPSYPDFLVCTEQREYCLVEIKRSWNDHPSSAQTETFRLLELLNIPACVMRLDDEIEETRKNILCLLKREINTKLQLEFNETKSLLHQAGLHLEEIVKDIQDGRTQDAKAIDLLNTQQNIVAPLFSRQRLHSRNNFRKI